MQTRMKGSLMTENPARAHRLRTGILQGGPLIHGSARHPEGLQQAGRPAGEC